MTLILYGITATSVIVLARRSRLLSARFGLALALVPLLFTGRALFTGRVYAPIDLIYDAEPLTSIARRAGVTSIGDPEVSDVAAQFIPWNAALRSAIAHHQLPLWNPFEFCGSVLAAGAQAAPYHPVTLLSLLLDPADGLTFIATITYLLAAVAAFLFIRTICTSELAAFFGAIGWCFSHHVVSFILTAHGASIAIFPLVLFGVHEIARQAARSFVLLVGAMTLMTLCGHPETLLHVAALSVAYMLVIAKKDLAKVIASVVAAGLTTLLITAAFLVPMLDAIPQTREYLDRALHEDVRNRNSWPVVLHLLRADVVPFADGASGIESASDPAELRHDWAGSAYAGALLLAPALYAIWRVRSRMTWFFIGVIVVSLLAGAEAPGLSAILQRLPLFNMAVNARMIAFAAFGICVLASIGFDRWLTTRQSIDVFFLLVTAGVVAMATSMNARLSPDFIRLASAREVLPLLLAFAVLRLVPSHRTASAMLIVLLLLQRSSESGGFVSTIDRRAFYPEFAGLELLRREASPFRIVGLDVLLTPNSAALYGLEDVRGYDAMTFGRLAETFPLWSTPQAVWSNRVDDLSRPFLSLMNVRYAFVPPGAPLPPSWHTAAKFANYRIAKNDAVLPRAFIPARVHVGTNQNELREMAACGDFGSEAWIETAGPPAMQVNGSGSVEVQNAGGQLRLHTRMDSPGWIVISEAGWKGWRVLRGAHRLKVHFADHAFIAVYVPRGESDLVVEYWPQSFVSGAATSLAALLILVLLPLVPRLNFPIRIPARPSPSSYRPTLPS